MDAENTNEVGFEDLIDVGKQRLDDLTIGTEEYGAVLDQLEKLSNVHLAAQEEHRHQKELASKTELEVMKIQSDADVAELKANSAKPTWFDRILKIGSLIAPVVSIGIMIWWDRREDGGHIMNQYINPALRSGDTKL